MVSALAEAFPSVKTTFEEGSDVLGYDLWQLVQQGPQEELNLTEKTQPMLLTAGVGLFGVLTGFLANAFLAPRTEQDDQAVAPAQPPPDDPHAGHTMAEPAPAAIAAGGTPVFAFKGESLDEYWDFTHQIFNWGPGDNEEDFANMILDDGGDATLLLYLGAQAEQDRSILDQPKSEEEVALFNSIRKRLDTRPGWYSKALAQIREALPQFAQAAASKSKDDYLASRFAQIEQETPPEQPPQPIREYTRADRVNFTQARNGHNGQR